ncbi:MAG: metallophosphoesterase family protein [Balneolaceae bacterium]
MPKIALISDIHGNLPALEAVLETLDKHNPDIWLCLGDIVGYGPQPAECVQIIMDRKIPTIMGNHDAGVAGKLTLKHFRDPNRKLIEMSQTLLNTEQLEWLRNLPYTLTDTSTWIASHATPIDPEKWMYLDSAIRARNVLNEIEYPLCFVGHTHVPALVSSQIGNLNFAKGNRHLINPGSVGQSRDNDYRASCAIIDTDKWKYENIRVTYNKESVVARLNDLGFSRSDARRLMRY